MLRNNADVRRCSYFELGLPVVTAHQSVVQNPCDMRRSTIEISAALFDAQFLGTGHYLSPGGVGGFWGGSLDF